MKTIDGWEIPSDEFIRGVKYTLMQLMDNNGENDTFQFYFKQGRKLMNANMIFEALLYNIIDFCIFGTNCEIRYCKWDKDGTPTKAYYRGGGQTEYQKRCFNFLKQLALDGLTLKDLEEWQNQKLQTEAK